MALRHFNPINTGRIYPQETFLQQVKHLKEEMAPAEVTASDMAKAIEQLKEQALLKHMYGQRAGKRRGPKMVSPTFLQRKLKKRKAAKAARKANRGNK